MSDKHEFTSKRQVEYVFGDEGRPRPNPLREAVYRLRTLCVFAERGYVEVNPFDLKAVLDQMVMLEQALGPLLKLSESAYPHARQHLIDRGWLGIGAVLTEPPSEILNARAALASLPSDDLSDIPKESLRHIAETALEATSSSTPSETETK